MLKLGKEISLAIVMKLILIFLLWAVCFSHPLTSHLSAADVARHFASSRDHYKEVHHVAR